MWERKPTRCDLPPDHPVAVLIAEARKAQDEARGWADRNRRDDWPKCKVFVKDCVICLVAFATPYTISTCSETCAAAKKRIDKQEAVHRRRARERDAFVAPVSRLAIYRRDGWICHLCRKPVAKDKAVPNPLAPTLDHVIPLAVGGTHEPANVSTAHFICNARKGARGGGEQLLLIG